MTTLVKLLIVKGKLKHDAYTSYNWNFYRNTWNTDITPTSGVRLFFNRGLFTHVWLPDDGVYTTSIRKGSRLYKWILKQRSFGGSCTYMDVWGKYYIIPQSW